MMLIILSYFLISSAIFYPNAEVASKGAAEEEEPTKIKKAEFVKVAVDCFFKMHASIPIIMQTDKLSLETVKGEAKSRFNSCRTPLGKEFWQKIFAFANNPSNQQADTFTANWHLLLSYYNEGSLELHYKANKAAYSTTAEGKEVWVSELKKELALDVSQLIAAAMEAQKNLPNKLPTPTEPKTGDNQDAKAKEDAFVDFENEAKRWVSEVEDVFWLTVAEQNEHTVFNVEGIKQHLLNRCQKPNASNEIDKIQGNCFVYVSDFHQYLIKQIDAGNFKQPQRVEKPDFNAISKGYLYEIDTSRASALKNSLMRMDLRDVQNKLDSIRVGFPTKDWYKGTILSHTKQQNLSNVAGPDENGLFSYETLPNVHFKALITVGTGPNWLPASESNMGVELELIFLCTKDFANKDGVVVPFYRIESATISNWTSSLFELKKTNPNIKILKAYPYRENSYIATRNFPLKIEELSLKQPEAAATVWNFPFYLSLNLDAKVRCEVINRKVEVALDLDWDIDWADKMREVEYKPLGYKNKFPYYSLEVRCLNRNVFPIK